MGYVISDDGESTEMVASQRWHVAQAVELDGEVYAAAIDSGYWGSPSTVYLLSSPCIRAIVDVAPDTLNARSGGQYVTCHITLPAGYVPSQIDASTVEITLVDGEGGSGLPIPFDPSFTPAIGDYDEDGILDLTVKFSRQKVVDIPLQVGERKLTVEGRLGTGRAFKGEDVVRVIDRGK